MKQDIVEHLLKQVLKGEKNCYGEGILDEGRILSLEEIKVIFLGKISLTLDKLHQHFETVDAVVFGSPQAKGQPSGKVRR